MPASTAAPGVVDVGVDVPLAVTADDEHGVTELDEAGAQHVRRPSSSESARRYITSYSGDARRLVGRRRRGSGRTACGSARRVGPDAGSDGPTGRRHSERAALAGADAFEALEQHDEPGAAGVDDAGAREHLELLGGARRAPPARPRAAARATARAAPLRRRACAAACLGGRGRHRAGDREDGPLLGVRHGLARALLGVAQSRGEDAAVDRRRHRRSPRRGRGPAG